MLSCLARFIYIYSQLKSFFRGDTTPQLFLVLLFPLNFKFYLIVFFLANLGKEWVGGRDLYFKCPLNGAFWNQRRLDYYSKNLGFTSISEQYLWPWGFFSLSFYLKLYSCIYLKNFICNNTFPVKPSSCKWHNSCGKLKVNIMKHDSSLITGLLLCKWLVEKPLIFEKCQI